MVSLLFGLIAAPVISHSSAWGHPLHTTLAELTCAPDRGVEIVLRVFADDFSAAVAAGARAGRALEAPPEDSAVARYLAATLSLADARGDSAPLKVVGQRQTGDLLWITLRAPQVRSLAGVRLTDRMLFERYDDQVNIVEASVAGRRRTLLFTKRDGATAKPL